MLAAHANISDGSATLDTNLVRPETDLVGGIMAEDCGSLVILAEGMAAIMG